MKREENVEDTSKSQLRSFRRWEIIPPQEAKSNTNPLQQIVELLALERHFVPVPN